MLDDVLMYGSIFSPLPGLLIGQRHWRAYATIIRTILFVVLLSFLSDVVMLALLMNSIPNMPVANIYGLTEGLLFSYFFYLRLTPYRKFIVSIAVIFALLYLADVILVTHLMSFNAYSRTLEAGIMILFSTLYFYSIFQNETDIFIDKSSEFWIVVGILFYFSGAFFSFLLSTDILSLSPDRFYSSWILHNISNIIKNIIFTAALWKAVPNSGMK
ncbi:hypothetical protein [Parachryseolinea silvisoli]|jgi:hypothetical protein|uniref:hypothetical protein n=1 Tax=Parachryseolinea silvisoli TaxID=2873601 RepID=UPI002265F1F1|nr:hypothetical protein [Parachryseolinea silvisoli]MCD9015897.1 hypothetical protein [Parachryseolinea silvisoli]